MFGLFRYLNLLVLCFNLILVMLFIMCMFKVYVYDFEHFTLNNSKYFINFYRSFIYLLSLLQQYLCS